MKPTTNIRETDGLDEMEKELLNSGNSVTSNSVGEKKNNSKFRNVFVKIKTVLINNLLLVLTLVGVVMGFLIGFGARQTNPTENALMWLGMYYILILMASVTVIVFIFV